MKVDIRDSKLYREIEALCREIRQPGTGRISDASEVNASPNGQHVVFSGSILDRLEGTPSTRICIADLATGKTRVLTFGPNSDRLPKFSPDGRQIAFLSDRRKAGDFQLYLLDVEVGAAHSTPHVDGWVESLRWSPDGRRILLGVAGHGADIGGGQGAISSQQCAQDLPSWIPTLDTNEEAYRWRRAWLYDTTGRTVRQISAPNENIWECAWSGNDALAAVSSPSPGEGFWYSAQLTLIDIASGQSRVLFRPSEQIGYPAGDTSGECIAFIEATCSDRWFVAGELRLIDIASGECIRIDSKGVDVTYAEWSSSKRLIVAGLRGFDTVVACYDVTLKTFQEIWSSSELTVGGISIAVSAIRETSDCVLVGEGFKRAPEIAVIRQGSYTSVTSFDQGYSEQANAIKAIERLAWTAPDGLEIQGWLLRPNLRGPHPLVIRVHGGPVGHWRPQWPGRAKDLLSIALIRRGYAVFLPNPRGSSGRGQIFARAVKGEMGGAETSDHLSGVDYLVAHGLADPSRLGVTGVSHGGYMSAWLITQDGRFAAAVPVAPVSNFVTEHFLSNIPDFVALFLQDQPRNPHGKYFQRSPLMHAQNVKTPTLSVCGSLDRCTPAEEAVQFHNALVHQGVRSVLVTYPEEGHGIYKFPAVIDYITRVLNWFEQHMSAAGAT